MLLECTNTKPAATDKELPGKWSIRDFDGQMVVWDGFYTGPVVLSDAEIDKCESLLLADAHECQLRPYVGSPGLSIILHSATQTTKGFEGDLFEVRSGRHAHDVATYLEARAVSLAQPGDLTVGRTKPWREATNMFDVESVDVGGLEYYYLTHALLVEATRYSTIRSPALTKLIDRVRSNPDCLIRLYALDRETRIFLQWIAWQAGVKHLNVEANGATIADRWNLKEPLHPTVTSVECITSVVNMDPWEILRIEREYSRMKAELGVTIPVLPGYTLQRVNRNERDFTDQLMLAASLLRTRYGCDRVCLKPSNAGDGARIVPGIPVSDDKRLQLLAQQAFLQGDDYLLEANLRYLSFRIGGEDHILAPSAHIRYGDVAKGVTLQLLNRTSWTGNIYVDELACQDFGLTRGQYRIIISSMTNLLEGFQGQRPGTVNAQNLGLVIGGVDFAVGQIGGRFGDEVVLAIQDLNLSSHGAEYLRSFVDRSQRQAAATVYAATKVIRPSTAAVLPVLTKVTDELSTDSTKFTTVASVPDRWGMIAAASDSASSAANSVFELERHLIHQELAH